MYKIIRLKNARFALGPSEDNWRILLLSNWLKYASYIERTSPADAFSQELRISLGCSDFTGCIISITNMQIHLTFLAYFIVSFIKLCCIIQNLFQFIDYWLFDKWTQFLTAQVTFLPMFLSGSMEQNRLLFELHERYKYLLQKTLLTSFSSFFN